MTVSARCAREIVVNGRTKQRRRTRLAGAKSLQNGAGSKGKTSKLGLPKRKEWPRCHKVSSSQRHESRFCINSNRNE